MGDLIRTIIRWIIIILIIILIIFLLFKITDKSSKTKKAVDTGVSTVKKTKDKVKETVKETVEDIKEDTQNPEDTTVTGDDTGIKDEEDNDTMLVDAPDTATTSALGLIGIIILSGGTYYIYRSRKALN